MAKKKTGQSPKRFGNVVGLQKLLDNEKLDFLLGLVSAIVALYILWAFVSFLKTGQADQSLLMHMRPHEWMNKGHVFVNSCGSLGAILSYFFITDNFGLSSFLIPVFFLVVGLKMMQIYKVNLWKWFFSLAVVMIWSSITLAMFLAPVMSGQVYNPGGKHGAYCVQQLTNLIGAPGLTIMLVLTAIVFLTFMSSQTIIWIRKMMNPVKYLTDKVPFTVTNAMNSSTHDTDAKEHIGEQADKASHEEDNDVNKKESEEPTEPTIINLTAATGQSVAEKTYAKPAQEPAKEKTVRQESESTISNTPANEVVLPASMARPSAKAPTTSADIVVEVPKEEEKANASVLANSVDLNTPINPKEPFTRYKYPVVSLLEKYENGNNPTIDMDEIKANNARIVEVLNSFGVDIKEVKATVGPTITLYEVTPAEGVRISKIRNLEDDIALSLSALGIRIIAPIPGKGTVGIEVPNKKKNIVSMESILNSKKFKECKFDLPIALGKTITNDVYIADLTKMPHLLVAGATGQGKSVGLNAIITSLLYKKHPNELKFVLVDPKKVEFSVYNPIANHFMAALDENFEEPIITDTTKVVKTLNGLCALMDNRYLLLKEAGARNIKEYNTKYLNHQLSPANGHEFMPYIVVIIDEFGDLIMTAGKDIERPIARIAQLARAVGIHMIIATQRPTTNIITGTIKANFPARMAFRVSAMIDSRTILDRPGANQLIGKGDMLIVNNGEPVRVQCALVETPEVERINHYISEQQGPVEPLEIPEPVSADGDGGQSSANGGGDLGALDPYFEEAARSVVSTQQGSTSMIQRRFSIGYNRAGRLMDQLEEAGVVGSAHGSKPRDVLINDDNQLNTLLSQIKK